MIVLESKAQSMLKELKYGNTSQLYNLENDPEQISNIEISEKLKNEIFKEKNSLEKPIEYFIKGIYYSQNQDLEKEARLYNKILAVKTDSVCEEKKSIPNKLNCAYSIRDLKAVILKKRMYDFFEEERRREYCLLFQEYKIDIEAEEAKFMSKILGSGICRENFSNPIFWDYSYNFLVQRFIEYDCLYEQKKYKEAFVHLRGSISNIILEYPESEKIQELVSNRILNYLTETGKLKSAKKELKKILRDFRKNAKPQNNVYYKFSQNLFDLPVMLETSGFTENGFNVKQKKRIRNNKPPMKKREIIKQFKQTKYYKIIKKGKL